MKIEIPLLCRSKKNSQEIRYNRRTKRPYISQSDLYKQFESDCGYFMPKLKEPIKEPINLKCTFIVPDRRKRDLTNLLNAIQDILVKYGVLEDDNSNVVTSLDGSRIIYQKGIGKTIVEINNFF